MRNITIQCIQIDSVFSPSPRKNWLGERGIYRILITSDRGEGRQNSSADVGLEVELQFEEGIERTVRWYLENEEWLENVTSGEYQT